MRLNDQAKDTARAKIQKVFSYIRELTKLRTPPVAQLGSYDWSLRFSSLPNYPSIQTAYIPDEESEFDGVVLRVKRPQETVCPPPPTLLSDWIENGWEQISGEANNIQARNRSDDHDLTITERFDEDPERVRAFEMWSEKRRAWQEAEKPVREAALVFSDLFKLHGQLQRESEKYQLYLGDGHLVWNSAVEAVDHPVLLKKIELEFDSSIPEFFIRESDDSPELYTSLLRHHELDGSAVLACKAHLDDVEPHPLSNGKTVDFLKFFVQRFFQDGRYYESREEISRTAPSLYRDPVIFLGNRTQGFAEALDKLIDAVPTVEFIPEALLRVVGIDEKVNPTAGSIDPNQTVDSQFSNKAEIDFLLTKPANKEQERVITQLEQTGSVLVQGPPGTGKSHTIANIIGHLLASGKTVLVSSHTSKALKVVREKVVKPLQPLCVSVLENDLESKAQLEESINGIVSYLSRTDSQSLSREIQQLGDRRTQIKHQLERLEAKALEIRKGEYIDIVVAGEGTPPSEAARRVCELEQDHGWIPEPMAAGAPNPLSEAELCELYATNGTLSSEDVRCIAEGLPDLMKVLKPLELNELALSLKSVDRNLANRFADLWQHPNQQMTALDHLSTSLTKSLEIFTAHKWIRKVVEDSKLGKERLQPWLTLIELIESTNQKVAERSELILKHGPQLSIEVSSDSIKTCGEILLHLRSGKNLGFFSTVLKSSWKSFLASIKVDGGTPSSIEHFEAVLAFMESTQLRRELIRRWERQVVALQGPELQAAEPEIHAISLVDALKLATNWTSSAWQAIEQQLANQGFNLKAAQEKASLTAQASGYIEHIQNLVENLLIPAMESRRLWVRLRELEAFREQTLQELKLSNQKAANINAYLRVLANSVEQLNVEEYEIAFNRYLDIRGKVDTYEKRMSLLQKLVSIAPGWADAIENRSGVHGLALLPGNPERAWRVCQWRQELEKRLGQDYVSVQREIQRLKVELNSVNAQYVEKLAWKYQHSRTGLREKQALTGWQQLQSKITKTGRGKRDVHIKREARKTLKDCKNAVPVWIMPLSRVFDSFDLVQTKFDVVLLDEASQSDITALVAFSIAKQVIVVGDNEQVTPYAVGQELGKIQSLIDELLQGIPNRMLYDGKTSVYDLAEQAFGETIRLVEHFRCVPDIIEFSNQLSYNGEIKPLRESSSSPYVNHLIAHRVTGATSHNKTNREEACEVASIVAAMTELPEYAKASIGVISMVGQEQAILIDSILQRELPTDVYSKHNLLCGNASQFQGDERDVIIISMVDACDDPPLSIRQTEDFKKAFNVAASRARNQLWVVHSLNPSTDLKPGDLRLRLIQHAENPKALRQAIEATQKKADPKSVVFEPMVIKDLMHAGFRVIPQFQVGAYTIDMVVEGTNKRIAVECDGDRYHPPEKLVDDINRQMVLERLGWSFIRIRGTEYFRHRDATLKRVIAELEAFAIERLGPASESLVTEKKDEVKGRVLQRAHEYKEVWKANSEIEPELEAKVRRGRWGRKVTEKSVESRTDGSTTKKGEPVNAEYPLRGNTALKLEAQPTPISSPSNEYLEELKKRYTAPDHQTHQKAENTAIKRISKSKIVEGLHCEKKVYLSVHHPSLKKNHSLSQQAKFASGEEVGVLARKPFKNGLLIDAKYWETEKAIEATKSAIAKGHNTLFEASFGNSDFHCRVDILQRNSSQESWNVFEVKSGLDPKPEYILDLAIQCWILNSCGIKWTTAYLVHLNRECKFPDLTNLFVHFDATDEVNKLLSNLGNDVEKIIDVVRASTVPDRKIGKHCDDPYACAFKTQCWSDFPKRSVFDLPGIGAVKGWNLISEGKVKIEDLNEFDFKGKTQRAIQVVKSNKRWTNSDGIKGGLTQLQWPLYFLDFETLAPVIPRYSGTSPYSDVPFQFSCHVWRSPDSEIEHFEYLHLDESDPRPTIIQALVNGIGESGSVVAFNKGTEKGILKKLADQFPKWAVTLNSIAERLVDPLPIFRENFCDPVSIGDFSIKTLAPAILGEKFNSTLR